MSSSSAMRVARRRGFQRPHKAGVLFMLNTGLAALAFGQAENVPDATLTSHDWIRP